MKNLFRILGLDRRRPSRVYAALPFAVFGFFVLCFALHPMSPIFTHRLADPDDFMRMNEVISWLQGQSWYDLSVPRMSPGAHTVIHWSRLIDIPIALVALPFIPHFGASSAVFIAAFIVPLLWLMVLLALLPAIAKVFVGEDRANLSCVMLLFAPMLLFNYTPGRAGHHGVQALIAGFGLLSLIRIIRDDKGALFAALVALAFSCSFWIGAEGLPCAIVFIACLGVAAAWLSGNVARNAAVFGICLPLFSAALIPIALTRAEFSSLAVSWFSPVYVIFAILSGAIFVAGWGIGKTVYHKAARLSVYALLGFAAAWAFFALVPSALRGPFADYDAFDATSALNNIVEAQPLIHGLHFNRFMPVTLIPAAITFSRFLFLPLVAFVVCLVAAKRAEKEMRLIWLAQGVFLLSTLALTLFWQSRVGIFAEFFSLVPLTYLLVAGWDKLGQRLWDRPLFWAEIGAFVLLGPLFVVLLPAFVDHMPIYPDVALFPADAKAPPCPMENVLPFLNDSEGLGAKPLTIMNIGDTGPQLLFATKHRIIAGNFNVPGNADAYAFFSSAEDAPALAAARKWNADLVMVCRHASTLYVGSDYFSLGHMRLLPGKDGLLHFTNIDASQPLIERLIRGQNPAWLKPIEIPVASDYLLFRVVK